MKKSLLLVLMALGLVFTACDTPSTPETPDVQKENEQDKETEKEKEEEKPVADDRVRCEKIESAIFFSDLVFYSDKDLERIVYENVYENKDEKSMIVFTDEVSEVIALSSESKFPKHIHFVVYYSDWSADKVVEPYKYKLISGAGAGLADKEDNSPVIFTKELTLENLNSLPSVKVSSVSGKTLYEKDLSKYRFINFNSDEKTKDDFKYAGNEIKKQVSSNGEFTFKDKLEKAKSFIDLNDSKYDEYFEFSYAEYEKYLEKAYNILKNEKLSEIKENAVHSKEAFNVFKLKTGGDSFPDWYAEYVKVLTDAEKKEIFSEVDRVYESFDSFKTEYFADYKDYELSELKFCIPRKVVLNLDSSDFIYEIYASYKGTEEVTERQHVGLFDLDQKLLGNFTKKYSGIGIFSSYGIFFNNAPGIDADSLEKETFKEKYPEIFKYYPQYQWHRDENDKFDDDIPDSGKDYYDGKVTEKVGGLLVTSDYSMELRMSSLKYVEVKKGNELVGKLRNHFFCYVDDGEALKKIDVRGSIVEDNIYDFLDDSLPFIQKYTMLVKNGDKYEVHSNGKYKDLKEPYFFIIGTYKGL